MRVDFLNGSVARQLSPPITHDRVYERREKQPLQKVFPVAEKILYLSSVVVCVAFSLLIISKHAQVTELSLSACKLEKSLHEMSKVNIQLETERSRLSSIDTIRSFAENKGLELSMSRALPAVHP